MAPGTPPSCTRGRVRCVPAEGVRRGRRASPVVLAVAVVHRVLGHHQACGDHQVVDGGCVRMAADHVAAHGEAVELLRPVLGVQGDLVQRPGLDSSAHLFDPHRVGLSHLVVVKARDRSALRRICRRFGRRRQLLPRDQAQARRAQAVGAQDPFQVGDRCRRQGRGVWGRRYRHGDHRWCEYGDGRWCGQGGRRWWRHGDRRWCGHGRHTGWAADGSLDIAGTGRGFSEDVRPEVGSGRRQARLRRCRLRRGHRWLLRGVSGCPGAFEACATTRTVRGVASGRAGRDCHLGQRAICTFSSTPTASGTRMAAE